MFLTKDFMATRPLPDRALWISFDVTSALLLTFIVDYQLVGLQSTTPWTPIDVHGVSSIRILYVPVDQYYSIVRLVLKMLTILDSKSQTYQINSALKVY